MVRSKEKPLGALRDRAAGPLGAFRTVPTSFGEQKDMRIDPDSSRVRWMYGPAGRSGADRRKPGNRP